MPLQIWLNAFIPRDVSGYTQTLLKGPHRGKTAIPLPGSARLNPGNLIKDWDAGYLTDQRGFSNSPAASVRMQSYAELSLSPRFYVSKTHHKSSGTTEVDLDTGMQLAYDVADMSRCSFRHRIRPVYGPKTYRTFPLGVPFRMALPFASSNTIALDVRGQAGDPLVYTAADIDYVGTFLVTLISTSPVRCLIEFSGKLDAFPAFECYAKLNSETKCLFTVNPPKGNTVVNLLGGATRAVRGRAVFS